MNILWWNDICDEMNLLWLNEYFVIKWTFVVEWHLWLNVHLWWNDICDEMTYMIKCTFIDEIKFVRVHPKMLGWLICFLYLTFARTKNTVFLLFSSVEMFQIEIGVFATPQPSQSSKLSLVVLYYQFPSVRPDLFEPRALKPDRGLPSQLLTRY